MGIPRRFGLDRAVRVGLAAYGLVRRRCPMQPNPSHARQDAERQKKPVAPRSWLGPQDGWPIQGQRTLNPLRHKDFHQEGIIPAAFSALADNAVL